MSTIYTWATENTADGTGQGQDWTLVFDTSTGRTKKATLSSVFLGQSPERVIGFYGETGVNQGTMTATALTALSTSVATDAVTTTSFGFGNSTTAKATVKRLSQIQADLEVLMGKLDSTGLFGISGV
jgi:hypothetical protein